MSGTDYSRARNGVALNEEGTTLRQSATETPARATDGKAAAGERTGVGPPLSWPAGLAVAFLVAVLLTTTIVHVGMVFLAVAPSNAVSQQYRQQINAWIYPYFEQDWKMFAPDPQSAQQQISVRTATTSPNGSRRVSDWVDLTAIDEASVRHNPFPSHTAQNMLRRAWESYLVSHGSSDQSHSERARMLREYLRNIATQRVAAHSPRPFDAVQLRVITIPTASPTLRGSGRHAPESPSNTRYLPWWQVKFQ
jgi:hypothetical protein